MLLFELFNPGAMTEQLRQAALDYLTPFLGQNVPFVTIDQLIDALRHDEFGIIISRPMVMDLLNPDEVEAVDKIEGDRIYLANPETSAQALDADDEQKNQEHVTDMASDQAKKTLQEPPPPPPPPKPLTK